MTRSVRFLLFLGGFLLAMWPPAPVFAHTMPSDPARDLTIRRSSAATAIDGVRGPGEYPTAADDFLDMTGTHLNTKVYIKRVQAFDIGNPKVAEEQLHIYFSVQDIDGVANDKIEFYFDRLHDHGVTVGPAYTDDVLLRIERGIAKCTGCTFKRLTRNASTGLFDAVANVAIADSTVEPALAGEYADGWTGEFVLRPGDLGWGYFPQVVGLAVVAKSANPNPIQPGSPASPRVYYPGTGGDELNTEGWANLKLRYPFDYGLVMDFSDSMNVLDDGTQSRWTRAKRAADLFHTAGALLRNPYLSDKISIMQYSWDCFNDADGNRTGSLAGLSISPIDIPSSPLTGSNSFTKSSTADPAYENCTPIQQGLVQALRNGPADVLKGMFGTVDPNAKRERILTLLSDGLHNRPGNSNFTQFNAGDPFLATEKNAVHVRTVAIGPDGSVDTGLLSAITNAFRGGNVSQAKYDNAPTFPDLLKAYLESMATFNKFNLVDDIGGFSPGQADKLVFVGIWAEPANAGDLKVTRNGADVNGTLYKNSAVGYAALVINNPQADGLWDIVPVPGPNAPPPPDKKYAFADLREFAEFLIEQKPYGAGDPILLQVSLKDRDKPVLSAEVTVEIAKPGEGLGNYLSTLQLNCSAGIPSLPPVEDRQVGLQKEISQKRAGAPNTSMAAITAARAGEPIPGRYALAAEAFSRCKKNGLNRAASPSMRLYDDGTHGDPVAGDGVYSLSYTDTKLEGSYTLRFHARGKNTDNVEFSRTRTVSQFVGIRPDPEATTYTTIAGPVIGKMQTATIYFLPRDPIQNYLGPGFSGVFSVQARVGQLAGPLKDLGNGYYAQKVQYLLSGPRPAIAVSMPGTCFVKVIDTGKRAWPLWMILLVILVILLLLLLWWWLKKKP